MPQTSSTPFLNTPLGQTILAGDLSGVMAVIDGLTPPERAQALQGVNALMIDRWRMVRQRSDDGQGWVQLRDAHQANRLFRAVDLARFMCDSALPQADYWVHVGIQDIVRFQQRYQPVCTPQAVQQHLHADQGWRYRHLIHRAVVAGLVPRPDTDEYLDSLFFGDLRQESNVVLKHVDADPDLAPLLLKLFEREGASDTSFAAVEKYCHDPALHWSTAFLVLCERGVFTRAQLLDRTLRALSCDWPQFKSGWFSRFHQRLAPSPDEMAPHAERYVALCQSRIAPTVSLAIQAVGVLYGAGMLTPPALWDGVCSVLNSSTKAHVIAALDLLTLIVQAQPELAAQASAAAVCALAHSAADVQKRVLACLDRWGLDPDTQVLAASYLPGLAAVHQNALRRVLGAAPPATAAPPAASAFVAPGTPPSAWDLSRAVAPIDTLPDLIERLAYVFEHPDDVQAWEQAAQALVCRAPLPSREHAAFAALSRRAKRLSWEQQPVAYALAQVMAAVLGHPVDPLFTQAVAQSWLSSGDFVVWRTASLLALVQRGSGLEPLSSPTHVGGWVDPKRLQQRLADHAQAGRVPEVHDLALAQMRSVAAPPGTPASAWRWSVSSSEGPYVFHQLHIHASPPAPPSAVVSAQAHLTVKWLSHGRWQSEGDAASIRFLAGLCPGDLEPFYAEGAHALGNNLDWWEANWQNRAYLDVLLASTLPLGPLGPMAQLMLALALAGKEPGQTALAVDALAQSLLQARVAPQAIGDCLAALWCTPLVKGPRLARSLSAVAQAHADLPRAVYPMVSALVLADPQPPRKDGASMLELMLELKMGHRLPLPDQVRQVLQARRYTGKARAAVAALLA